MKKRYAIISALILILLAAGATLFMRACRPRTISLKNEDEVTEALKNAMEHRSYSFTVRFTAYSEDSEALRNLADRLIREAPYSGNEPEAGDYLKYQCGGYRLDYKVKKRLLRYDYELRVMPDYYTTAEEEEKVSERVSAIITSSGLSGDSDAREKAAFVHDYICENVSYDTVHKHTPGSGHLQSTAYGTLFYNTALCQGYAVLCYRLLRELGVENDIVTGEVYIDNAPERHAWNRVYIGDEIYYMDVTLDDVNGSRDYFLKTYDEFSRDHKEGSDED